MRPEPRTLSRRRWLSLIVGGASVGPAGLSGLACVANRPAARGPAATPPAPATAEGGSALLEAVVAAHNAERSRRRLAPLKLDPILTLAAQGQADAMARRGRMSHRGGDRSSPMTRIERVGYAYRAAGENVAFGFDRVDEVMAGWMHSPGHRRNILGNFAEIGVGHAIAPGGAGYWCVTFGTPVVRESR